jgi:uncharacterized delta-60 repeat protein
LVVFTALAVQPDGKVVAWSPAHSYAVNPSTVARVNADGSLDSSFDSDGIVQLTWPGGAQNVSTHGGLVLQPDGNIVVSGGHFDSIGNDFDLARLNADVTLDS